MTTGTNFLNEQHIEKARDYAITTRQVDLAQRGPCAGRSALSYPRPRNDRRAAYL